MRILIGLVFFPLYLGWLVYRIFVKKDLKKHISDFYGLTFFIIVWALIFIWLYF